MNTQHVPICRPALKTRKFSSFHIEVFEFILIGKTNREINRILGYTQRSHAIVDHSRKVMNKLLAMEGLSKRDHSVNIVFPRRHCFWWKKLLEKHRDTLLEMAIKPEFY